MSEPRTKDINNIKIVGDQLRAVRKLMKTKAGMNMLVDKLHRKWGL